MPHTWHDTLQQSLEDAVRISIHMPHTWHDASSTKSARSTKSFQSTCHIRGMTIRTSATRLPRIFQSTCHIRGMTVNATAVAERLAISIHMPHTWHDHYGNMEPYDYYDISIHMPHTWHDALPMRYNRRIEFQSTCHIRGMTRPARVKQHSNNISIHMPHTWHDRKARSLSQYVRHFNPHATYVA